MNIYKKLFFVLVILTQSINSYANTDKSKQALLQFVQQTYKNESFKENIKQIHKARVRQLRQLQAIQEQITETKYQKTIEDIKIYLSEQKEYLNKVYQFLSKKTLNQEDIDKFAEHFNQHKHMFFPEESAKSIHDESQEYNFALLSRLQEITLNRSKHNLGNFIRNSHSSNPTSVLGRINRNNTEN